MASLLIRKLDDTLHARLKARALQHGHSLEEEVRETLRLALARDASVQEPISLMRIARQVFGHERGIDPRLPARSLDPDRVPPDLNGSRQDT
jgi:plasmid stability protein